MILNSSLDWRNISDVELLPVVAFWSIFNMLILLIVMTAAVPRPAPRSEERFPLTRACRLVGNATEISGETRDVSLPGSRILLHEGPESHAPETGDWIVVEMAGIGAIPSVVRRVFGPAGARQVGVAFHAPSGGTRRALLQALFASGLDGAAPPSTGFGLLPLLIFRAFGAADAPPTRQTEHDAKPTRPPDWVLAATMGDTAIELDGSRSSRAGL